MNLYQFLLYTQYMGNQGLQLFQIVKRQPQNSNSNNNPDFVEEVSCKGENLYKVQQIDRENNPYMLGICAMTFKRRKSPAAHGRGTAFLLSSDLALTCAHNIFHKDSQDPHFDVKLYPGAHGELQNYVQIESYEILPVYKTQIKVQGQQSPNDYALLKLSNKVPNTNGSSYLTLGKNFTKNDAVLEIFGYPATKYQTINMDGTRFSTNLHGLKKNQRIKNISRQSSKITYQITTEGGQSGCPIITDVKGKPVVIGVHCGGKSSQQINIGRLISDDMISNLLKWADQMKGSPFKLIDLEANQIINFDLDWSKNTPFVNHFEVKGKALKRIPVNDETAFEYYQIVSQNCLPVTGTFEMNFRVIKYGESFSFITFGVILAGRKDMKDSGGEGETHRGSLGYQTGAFKYGNIFIDGELLANFQQQTYIPQGKTLKMEINCDKNIVSFINNSKKKTIKLDLPASFKGNDIIPFVSMSHSGDYIEIL